jgi:hypothetical protein
LGGIEEQSLPANPGKNSSPPEFQLQTDHAGLFQVQEATSQSFPPGVETASQAPPTDFKSLLRPRLAFNSEWITSSDFNLSNFDLGVTLPTYPIFGPPPPMINVGFAYTNLADAQEFELPADLFTYSVGLSWMRILNDRWKIRSTAGVALATDNRNTTSEAWQFRGGVFAIYEPNERWQWVFGGIALGRRDLPFVPALGAIWTPTRWMKYDFTFPRPKISRLLSETDLRQRWAYLGMELSGNTWAYETVTQTDEQLTYGDWRAVIGWESVPASNSRSPFAPGRKLGLEFGYVFARELTRSEDSPELSLSNGIVFGFDTRF